MDVGICFYYTICGENSQARSCAVLREQTALILRGFMRGEPFHSTGNILLENPGGECLVISQEHEIRLHCPEWGKVIVGISQEYMHIRERMLHCTFPCLFLLYRTFPLDPFNRTIARNSYPYLTPLLRRTQEELMPRMEPVERTEYENACHRLLLHIKIDLVNFLLVQYVEPHLIRIHEEIF